MSTHALIRVFKAVVALAICNLSAGCLVNHAVTARSGALMRGQQDSGSSISVGATVLPNAQSGSEAKTQEPLPSGIAEMGTGTTSDNTAAKVIKYWLIAAMIGLVIIALSFK